MLSTAVIVFREVLEAALIIGILAAATRLMPGRRRWLAAGLGLGLAGSVAVAFFAGGIAELASGMGQELFNAMVLGIAVLMLAWHSIWMASHGAEMARAARSVGQAISDGRQALSVLLVVVAVAVLREGSETVLFLYGIASGEGASVRGMLGGGLLGAAGGAAVGYALYAGLVRVPVRWFFTATSALVVLMAAGLAAQMAKYLVQADILPSLAAPLWDTSSILPQSSVPGMLLHSLMGYDAAPGGMQVVFYVATLLMILAGMRWAQRPATPVFKPLTPMNEGAVS